MIGSTHPGATRCLRKKAGSATQQCCYHNDKLITGGLGAGSADRNDPDHLTSDVTPWLCAMMLDGKFEHVGGLGSGVGNGIGGDVNVYVPKTPGVHLKEYMRRRPANNGNGCDELIKNGIDY